MSDVPQSWRTVLEAVAAGMSPWVTPAAVAERLGRDVEETTDALASLDEAGLVAVREPDDADGPVVSLSPRGAEVVRPAFARRPAAARDRRAATATAGWASSYDRPNRSRIAATAAGSVVS